MTRRPPSSPLFPSTPLSRSRGAKALDRGSQDAIVLVAEQSRLARVGVERAYRETRVGDAPPPLQCRLRDARSTPTRASRDCSADRKSTRLNSSHDQISYAGF